MPFRSRSTQKEFLDEANIPKEDLFRNLHELDIINTRLGGYAVSLKGLRAIMKSEPDTESLLDIGFGGGDAMKQLALEALKNKRELFLYGVDLKSDCLEYAEKNLLNLPNKLLICNDYRLISAELLSRVDVIHCSLFLHHLTNEEIIELFQFARQNKCTLLVNDLHRHFLAYYSIKLLTALFSKSYLVKNDAPISVKRGFKKSELKSLLEAAGYKNYSLSWCWAFRYLIIAKP